MFWIGFTVLGRYLGNLDGVCEEFGVSVEESGHVFPDGNTLGIEAVGEDGGRVVGTLAAEGGGLVIDGATNESLRQDDL